MTEFEKCSQSDNGVFKEVQSDNGVFKEVQSDNGEIVTQLSSLTEEK
jgi:hypothetical protein